MILLVITVITYYEELDLDRQVCVSGQYARRVIDVSYNIAL